MPQHIFTTGHTVETALILLQAFQVVFLWIHDWVPLGRLNDVAAVRSQDTLRHLIGITLLQSVPFTVGLYFSLAHFGRPYPAWLLDWLTLGYGFLFLGQLQAWWIPYLFRPEPERAARYRVMFGKTHSFLPMRNGLVPNTAHILLHIATDATLCLLFVAWRAVLQPNPYPLHPNFSTSASLARSSDASQARRSSSHPAVLA